MKLEENCGGGRGRVGRGPGHPSRSRSPEAGCERGYTRHSGSRRRSDVAQCRD